ncbi:hypothetical protein Q7689_03395 [Nocardiopsis tropica]|nr:hypothetical protein [Nocardiopsis tropica]
MVEEEPLVAVGGSVDEARGDDRGDEERERGTHGRQHGDRGEGYRAHGDQGPEVVHTVEPSAQARDGDGAQDLGRGHGEDHRGAGLDRAGEGEGHQAEGDGRGGLRHAEGAIGELPS